MKGILLSILAQYVPVFQQGKKGEVTFLQLPMTAHLEQYETSGHSR